ncbi:BlaI/MecI/CopY family transcriptional regulator [Alteromonas gracilis]
MRRLGHLEAAVMERLWAWERAASVRDVVEVLSHDRRVAYTTVLTVLDNLHGKGLVDRVKVGRAYAYSARLTRAAHTTHLIEGVLDETADRSAALLHFVGQLSADEQARLRQALDDAGGAT